MQEKSPRSGARRPENYPSQTMLESVMKLPTE